MKEADFIAAFDAQLKRRFCVGMVDVGVGSRAVVVYHDQGFTPTEAVEHFGQKYKLEQ